MEKKSRRISYIMQGSCKGLLQFCKKKGLLNYRKLRYNSNAGARPVLFLRLGKGRGKCAQEKED